MKTIVTDAIILKRIDYSEADRIITVLTRERGKVQLLAKGIRRSKSKLAGGLELFSVTNVSYIDGRSDLKTVIGTQLQSFFSIISSDLERTMLGYEFLKLTNRLTEDESEPIFFELLESALQSLNDARHSVALTESWFLLQLAIASGEGLLLERTLSGAQFSNDDMYRFDAEEMGFTSHNSGIYSPKHIRLLRLLAKASKPEMMLKVQGSEELLIDLAALLKLIHNIG